MTLQLYQTVNPSGKPESRHDAILGDLLDALARAVRHGQCDRARHLDAELARLGMAPRLFATSAGGDR